MKWGYASGGTKAHFFIEMKNPDIYISLCNKVASFMVNEVEEGPNEAVHICFGCLLAYIQKKEVRP